MSNINSAWQNQLQVDQQPSSKKKPFSLKVVLLGNYAVGKTAFVIRLCDKRFNPETVSTVGVGDVFLKDLKIHNNVEVRTQIWDTAGQERYKSLSKIHIRSADGLIVFYDVNNRDSFEQIPSWIQLIEEMLDEEPYVLMLVGTKVDENKRKIKEDEGQKLAKDLNALFFEVSSKTGENVEDAFSTLAEELHEKNVEKYRQEILQMEQIEADREPEQKNCCSKK